jgi:hypothetical protein
LPAYSAKRVSWRGSRVKTMQGNGVRVRSLETDVRGIAGPNKGSLLDASALLTHLSLSLSLSAAAEKRLCCADSELLAPPGRSRSSGPSRAPACGPHTARAPQQQPATAAPIACARVDNELGRAPHNPWSSPEEALLCVYFSRVGVVGPSAAVPSPNPGSRRPLLSSRPAGFSSSVVGPSPSGLWRSRRLRRVLQHAPVAVVRAERRGPIDPGPRRSPTYVSLAGGGC